MHGVLLRVMSAFTPKPPAQLSAVQVLLVEDDPIQQEITSRMIRQGGIKVETASTEGEALTKMAMSDVLILDWKLSRGTGETVLDYWIETHAGRPAAIISGYVTPELRNELLGYGVFNVIDKPVPLQVLSRLVHRYTYQVRRDKEIGLLREELYTLKRNAFYILTLVLATNVGMNWDELGRIIGGLL